MNQLIGRFETPNGAKYISQLCKHFAHKVEAEADGASGFAKLPCGPAQFSASDASLEVRIDLVAEDKVEMAKHIIDAHLARFAFRENFEAMAWDR
ncbi:MAG: DUF2218 domain-containing protein [Dinoroseobacter sp.]|nr:DUF2218 domain-containing protein [Dinoroseobacter sp.]NQZ73846.1 DUF2218 domain-containing protein [Dinoroseobacter sp.]